MLAPFFLPFDSIFPGIIITDFVFPALIFASFYLMLASLTGHRFFALFASLALMLFPQMPHYLPPSSFMELRLLVTQFFPPPFSDTSTLNLTYLARESFIPGAAFFIFFLYSTYGAVNSVARKLCFVCAGVFYGLLFYLYFYFWAFATVFLGLLFIALLIQKRAQEAKTIFLVGLIGIVVSVPFWISHMNLVRLPNYEELIARAGPELGHAFRWFLWKSYAVVFLMAGLALWIGKRYSAPVKGAFLSALAVAEIVVLNEQVITGFNIQSDHWASRVFLITRGIILFTLLYHIFFYVKEKRPASYIKNITIVFASAMLAILAGNVVYAEVVQSKENAHLYTVDPALMESYEWLNINTPKDSVVLSPSLLTNIDLPVYTHARIFLARSQNSLASEEELLNRLYVAYSSLGISPAYVDKMIQSQEGILYFFTAKYLDKGSSTFLRPEMHTGYILPRGIREKVLNEYVHFKTPEVPLYRLDYVFFGPREREIGIDESRFKEYDTVYNRNGVFIYQWRK